MSSACHEFVLNVFNVRMKGGELAWRWQTRRLSDKKSIFQHPKLTEKETDYDPYQKKKL